MFRLVSATEFVRMRQEGSKLVRSHPGQNVEVVGERRVQVVLRDEQALPEDKHLLWRDNEVTLLIPAQLERPSRIIETDFHRIPVRMDIVRAKRGTARWRWNLRLSE